MAKSHHLELELSLMKSNDIKNLQEIGLLLDQKRYEEIRSYRSGIIKPCVFTHTTQTKEPKNERKRQNEPAAEQGSSRSSAKSWSGPPGRQGKTNRPWSPLQPTQILSTDLKVAYESELESVIDAFPNTQVWRRDKGLWLASESALLPDYCLKAKFITWLPYSRTSLVRGWGFWEGNLLQKPLWIGPRHTNYDGSICAFEPTDLTWVSGNSIVDLLRYYTLWAVRHLHLKIYGRWPGHQVVHTPRERLLEVRGDEFCGCEHSDQYYSKCCYENDLNSVKTNNNQFLNSLSQGEKRKPPLEIYGYVIGKCDLPEDDKLSSIFLREYVKWHFDLSCLLKDQTQTACT